VLDLLLPQRCLVCGRGGTRLCTSCRDGLRRIEPPLCERCGAPTAWPVRRCRECAGRRLAFASARAAVAYDEAVRRLVRGWKEQGLRGLADDAAAIAAEVVAQPAGALAVTFVPPDPDRALRRGHHPAERLARALAARWELPCVPLLARTHGARQRGRTLRERRRNVARAFRPTGPAPLRVVLVDDVYTTGATASAAASALRRAGVRRVDVVAFARALRGYA
jgi:predicted amidophosphoribosyltransferase